MAPRKKASSALAVSPAPEAPYLLKLTPAQLTRLESQITIAYEHHMRVLRPYHTKIKLWRDLYDGGDAVRPTPESRPWSDASAIFFPLPRMVADTASARITQTLTQQRDFLAVEATIQSSDYSRLSGGGDLLEDINAFRRGANEILWDERQIDIRTVADQLASESSQIGTCISRTAHSFRRAPRKLQIDGQGSVFTAENLTLSDRVEIRVIPMEACVWDTTARISNDISFFTYPFELSYPLLKNDPTFNEATVADILIHPDSTPTDSTSDRMRRAHLDPSTGPIEEVQDSKGVPHPVPFGSRYTLHEVYLRNIDVNDDGTLEDVIVTWHRASHKIARVILFHYIHNESPIDFLWYQQRHNHPIGQGVIEPGETLAAGVNTIANQTIDAQTIRNTPTIITDENSEAADDLEADGWHPGQILRKRTGQEIKTLEFGQSSAVLSLSIFDRFVDIYFRINHLGPAQFGDVRSAQRAPADLGQSIMLEGFALLDKVISRFRSTLTSVCSKALAITWQTNPAAWARAVGPEDFAKIKRLIGTLGWNGLSLDLNISSAAHSRELDRQNTGAAFQSLGQYQRAILEVIGLAFGTVDPKTGEPLPQNQLLQSTAAKFIRSTQIAMRQFLDKFPNITDPEELTPDVASDVEAAAAAVTSGGSPIAGQAVSPLAPVFAGPGAGAIRQGAM